MRNINKFLTGVALVLTMFSSGQALYATNINQELLELKQKYEDAYKRYTTAIKEGATSTIRDLSEQVKRAKAKYEEAKNRFSLSEKTKKNIKDGASSIAESVSETFAYGTGNSTDLSTDDGKGKNELKGFKDYEVNIKGNNYCGQFATTLLFQYYGVNKDGNKVYSETNPGGIFTAPPTLVDYLNRNGIDANEKNNASIQDIVSKIKSGTPVVVLVNSGGTPHWVTVCGYTTDDKGQVKGLKIRDSVWGRYTTVEKSVDEFREIWKNPMGTGFTSNFVGYSNLMIDVKGTKTPSKSPNLLNVNISTATEDNISSGINDVVTGFRNLQPTTLLSGITKCVLGIPGAVAGIAGEGIKTAGEKMVDWGKKEWNEGGVGDKIAGGLAVAGGYLTQGAGYVAKAGGNILSGIANMGGNLINKLGYVFR